MQYRALIRDAMVTAMINAQTAAGDDVYAPRSWPETPPELPTIIVSIPADTKIPWGPNGPKFTTTAHIVALGRVRGSNAMDAEAQIEMLIEQIQIAVLTDLRVLKLVEKFSMVDTRSIVTDDGEDQIGEASIDFAVDFPEIFPAQGGMPLTSIDLTLTTPGTELVLAKATLPQS